MCRNAIKQFYADSKRHTEIIAENREAVDERNKSVLRISLFSGAAIFALVLLMSFVYPAYAYLRAAYFAVLLLFCALLALLRYGRMPVIVLVYTVFALLIAYSAVTSAFLSPNYICVTILAFLFQFPILYLDRDWRVNLATLLAALAYLAVIYGFKEPVLFGDEAANVGSFVLVACIVGSFTRASQLQDIEMKQRLNTIAYTDQLTGLANRRSFFERLAACEKPGCPDPIRALALIDIDEFKRYNDIYGHQTGDDCLRVLGACFHDFETQYGVVFYRYGGEEFVMAGVYQTGKTLFETAGALRARVAGVHVPGVEDGGGITITISVGVSAFTDMPEHGYNALLSVADAALYAAKKRGRDRAVLYDGTQKGKVDASSFQML